MGTLMRLRLVKRRVKRGQNYMKNTGTEASLPELESVLRIRRTEVVQVRGGSTPEEQATWLHPAIAINLAQWCSPRFAVQASPWVHERLTPGKVVQGPGPAGDRIIDGLFVSRRWVEALIETRPVQLRQMPVQLQHVTRVLDGPPCSNDRAMGALTRHREQGRGHREGRLPAVERHN